MSLSAALDAHVAAAPTFLPGEGYNRDWHEQWLSDPANALWLAYEGAEPVAFMCQGPASDDACTIIRDPGTTSIAGAYTREDLRGRGLAAALLQRVLEWARDTGYERCAVDFGPLLDAAFRAGVLCAPAADRSPRGAGLGGSVTPPQLLSGAGEERWASAKGERKHTA